MGWFGKDKEKNVITDANKDGNTPQIEEPTKVSINKEYPYIVRLNDVEGSTIIERSPFGAKRYIEGANVFLVNEKLGFKEPFPEDTDFYKQYKLDEIKTKITEIEKKLEKYKKDNNAKTPEELDLIQDYKAYKGFQRSIELQGKGSYVMISKEQEGRPIYTFDRKGNFKLPVFKNIDYSLLYVPTEADLTQAGELLKLNEEKNGDKEPLLKLSTIIILILLILAFLTVVYFLYKMAGTPQVCVDGLINVSNSLNDITQHIGSITDKIEIKSVVPTVEPSTTIIK